MNAHALGVLELSRVLGLVADRASSHLGAARVRDLGPRADRGGIERELGRVEAARALIGPDNEWAPEPVPDLMAALDRLRVDGTAWTGHELRSAAVLIVSARRTRSVLADERRSAEARQVLADVGARLPDLGNHDAAIGRAIDEDGGVRDEASPQLRRLRRELQGSERELIALLERLMSRLEAHQQVPDMSVTVRNGRYVIPVRRDGRSAIGGIVHDTSASGATLFVEPPAAVEAGNRIRELESEERSEVERVLRELTDALRPRQAALVTALDALVELDTLYARARFANEFACHPVTLAPPAAGFTIREGRHPLLIAQGESVVPFDLVMSSDERTLLVSGPNTGGKTVLLKSVALCSVLAQSGIPAPVGPGTQLAIFDDVFADIGDEQSIQASLSTFSAHLRNLGDILARATPASLVLIDELGSGTDPLEGAALGGAILEELTARGAMTLATTHLGALKDLATEVRGVVNASLQFDTVHLAPTYRLIKGVPGRSYGLSIARRLALPDGVLERAEARVPRVERDVEALLAELERRAATLAERERAAADAIADAADRAMGLDARERTVKDRERALEQQSRQEARRYLLNARAQVEQTVRELRAAAAGGADAADEVRRARQRVEELAAEHGDALAALELVGESAPADPPSPAAVAVGKLVAVPTLGGKVGRLIDVRGGDAVVAVGAVKMHVPADTLRPWLQAPPPGTVPVSAPTPEADARPEIDLRGFRAADIEDALVHAIDAAVQADLPTLRIIHGKGTGALRDRVAEVLRQDRRVKQVRLGAWNEGGGGVTVAELA